MLINHHFKRLVLVVDWLVFESVNLIYFNIKTYVDVDEWRNSGVGVGVDVDGGYTIGHFDDSMIINST
ncbi:hypothetical protein DERF_004359 [Dermatophagoides farinae]|uniref:Uncharacterized protein n=1 Tax=Dermatophagoides farinae TaxID=6954 RepID=A0A922I5X9_DERFA|nr:hypothetical protein DERF_004359 [Dermatophagoides farinae]